MLFNRIMVFLGGVIIFAIGLLLAAAAWPWPEPATDSFGHHILGNHEVYAERVSEFITSCRCIWPSNAWWYGALGYLLMLAPVLYLWNLWSAWRVRRFWQLALGHNVISVDLKPLERALRNQLEMQEDVEAAKMRLVIPEFGRNQLIGVLSITIAEQPNLHRRVEELRQMLVDQVHAMLPELKLTIRVRIRLASRLDARLFAAATGETDPAATPAPNL